VLIDERSFEQADALREEIRAFLGCIRAGRPPVVSGEDGLQALETAIRITGLLAEQHANGGSAT
jgi:predicted dehydrogenase